MGTWSWPTSAWSVHLAGVGVVGIGGLVVRSTSAARSWRGGGSPFLDALDAVRDRLVVAAIRPRSGAVVMAAAVRNAPRPVVCSRSAAVAVMVVAASRALRSPDPRRPGRASPTPPPSWRRCDPSRHSGGMGGARDRPNRPLSTSTGGEIARRQNTTQPVVFRVPGRPMRATYRFVIGRRVPVPAACRSAAPDGSSRPRHPRSPTTASPASSWSLRS